MAKETRAAKVCYRHPTKVAKRKCHHCGRPLCPQCQKKINHHIYCSKHCASAERRAELLHGLLRWNKKALSGTWFRVLFFTILIAAGVGVVWISGRIDDFIPSPQVAFPRFKKIHATAIDLETLDWDLPGAITIDSPKAGEAFTVNSVSVNGKAPPEAMVGLYVNNRKAGVQLSRDGSWRFDKVPLTEKVNVIQARYFDNSGNSSYSSAVWVTLRARPALVAAKTGPSLAKKPLYGLSIERASVDKRRVYLTFDGGSDSNATENILDVLKREHIHATIFLTGVFMRKYPRLVQRIVDDGHTVGNHTFSHPHLTTYSFNERQSTLSGITEAFLDEQLKKAAETFKLITGKEMSHFWRAPFGEYNGQILRWAAKAGYRHVRWSPHLDSLDWVADHSSPLFHLPQTTFSRILRRADRKPYGINGGIILMHLGTERKASERLDMHLQDFIEALKARSYTFGTIDQTAWARRKPASD